MYPEMKNIHFFSKNIHFFVDFGGEITYNNMMSNFIYLSEKGIFII